MSLVLVFTNVFLISQMTYLRIAVYAVYGLHALTLIHLVMHVVYKTEWTFSTLDSAKSNKVDEETFEVKSNH